MKKIILTMVLALCLLSQIVVGQIDLSRYFDESSLSFLNVSDHLDVKFAWNMKGNVQVFMNEGLNYLYEDNLTLSITNFDEVIKLDSALWVSYYYRGIAHKKLFQLKEAERDFLTSLRLNPQAETYLELGEIYHFQNQLKKAEDTYKQSIKTNPKLVQVYYNLGNLSLSGGDLKKALSYYQQCNEIDSKFPDAYLNQGILKFRVKKNDNQSIAFFSKAIEIDSVFSQGYFWRGLAYLSLNETKKCMMDWDRLVRLNPENTFYILMRGYLHIELKDFDNAFIDLRKAMRAVNVNEDKFEGAQTVLDKQIDLQAAANYLIANGYGLNEGAFSALKKSFCLLLAGQKEEALKSVELAEKIQPSATVYFLRAIAHEHMRQHNQALEYYSKALKLDNDIFDAHKKRSVYRLELKDWSGANQDFNDMLRLQPESPVVYRLRGLMKSIQEDYQGAIEDLSLFIKTDSSDYEALRTRSVCYLMLDKGKEANDDLRRILRVTPNNWQLYEDVAVNYLALNDTVNAIAVLEEFAMAKPDLFIPFFLLADIYIHQKDWEKATIEIDTLHQLMLPKYVPIKYAQVLFWGGLIEFEKLNYSMAIGKFNQSLQYNQNNLDAKYYRAKAYEKTGEIKKSLSDYKDLMATGFKDSSALYNSLKNKQ